MQVMQFNMLILGNWLEFGFDETERTAVENTPKKCVFCTAASSVFKTEFRPNSVNQRTKLHNLCYENKEGKVGEVSGG